MDEKQLQQFQQMMAAQEQRFMAMMEQQNNTIQSLTAKITDLGSRKTKTRTKTPVKKETKVKIEKFLFKDEDVLAKITKSFSEAQIKEASKFDSLYEENGRVVGGEIFRSKFLDYLSTLGLREALEEVKIQNVDLSGEEAEEQEELHERKIEMLLADPDTKHRWDRAFQRLKNGLQGNLYKSLVVRPSKGKKKENFFTLWDRLNKLIGGIGSQLELDNLTKRWENIEAKPGMRVSELLTEMDEIADSIQAISEETSYSDTQKNAKICFATRNIPCLEQPRNKMKGKYTTKKWIQTKELFMTWAPYSDEREELPLTEPNQEEPIAAAAQKQPRTRPPSWRPGQNNEEASEEKRCEYCNRRGHTVEECRSKRYTGYNSKNPNCRTWVNEGKCDWQNNPKNLHRSPCKFEHPPSERGKGGWTDMRRRYANNTEEMKKFKEEITEANKQHVQDLKEAMMAVVNKLQDNRPQQTDPTAGLVEIPIGFSSAVETHNTFEPLSDDNDDDLPELVDSSDSDSDSEEDQPQPKPKKKKTQRKPKTKETNSEPRQQQSDNGIEPSKSPSQGVRQDKQQNKSKIYSVYDRYLLPILILLRIKTPTTQPLPIAQANGLEAKQEQPIIILDTGCTDSTTTSTLRRWLTNILPTKLRMYTATTEFCDITEKGQLEINGLKVNVLHAENFTKTLISYSDLADIGITGTMDTNEILLFKDGSLWATVKRHSDRLWHFTDAEEKYN